MRETALVLLAHGSRDELANREFEELARLHRARRPGDLVLPAHVELARPGLEESLASAAAEARRVVVVPAMLWRAGHVKNDLPIALARARSRFPGVEFVAAEPFGVHPALAALAADRALGAFPEASGEKGGLSAVIVGRGSSDPDANGDFFKLARLFGEGRPFAWVFPAFAGISRPLVPEALELAARTRPARLVVVPYLLFAGRLAEKLARQVEEFRQSYPWIDTRLAGHLGGDGCVLDLLDERVAGALAGKPTLPCDACQYRTALPGKVAEVGGLRALLWSVRHMFTHSIATPHLHAHRPISRHVFVCGNVDCADRGSIALVEELRRRIKDRGAARSVLVTRTSCMGRCGEGPTVAVYPDGVWYRGVRAEDAEELVQVHLLGDSLVARLVDSIVT